MPGNERVRYCPQCRLNVYNFSALSPREINDLVRKNEGRLCGRYYQRADGTMLAQNCPVAFRNLLVSSLRVAAGVVAAAMVGMSPSRAGRIPAQENTKLTQIHPASKSLSIIFTDPAGGTIRNVKVTLHQGEKEFTAESNDEGWIYFSNLPKGVYELSATSAGFRTFHISELKAPYSPPIRLEMQISALMGEVVEVKENYQPGPIHRWFANLKHFFQSNS
jgi:hypothetical protein